MSTAPVTSVALYDIVIQANSIERAIAEARGELSPELEQQLCNVDLSLAKKVDGYAAVMDRLENDAVYWKAKAQELTAIQKGLETAVAKIKERLKDAMISMRKEEALGEATRFALVPTKNALVIEDASKLPSHFTMSVTTMVPDKEKIREALERAEDVPGAKLVGGYALRKYANRSR